MKVLIALDDSECSRLALESVLNRPWPGQSIFKVLNIVEPFDPINSAAGAAHWHDWVASVNAQRRFEANSLVEKAVDSLRSSHSDCESDGEIRVDLLPDRTIVEAAEAWSADLIVLGSHSRRGLERVLLGSIAHSVLQLASCCVEIIKPVSNVSPERFNVILALDSSPQAEKVLTSVAERPWPENAAFRILMVLDSLSEICIGDESPLNAMNAMREQEIRVERLRVDLAEMAASLRSRSCLSEVSFEILAGHPRDVILKAIEDWPADFVILGSGGKNALKRFFLGSVSHAVSLYSSCSVEVVK